MKASGCFLLKNTEPGLYSNSNKTIWLRQIEFRWEDMDFINPLDCIGNSNSSTRIFKQFQDRIFSYIVSDSRILNPGIGTGKIGIFFRHFSGQPFSKKILCNIIGSFFCFLTAALLATGFEA